MKVCSELHCLPSLTWQEDLLFLLQQEQAGYEFCQKQMAECDAQRQQYLAQRKDRSAGATLPEEKRQRRQHKNKKNYPQFDVREQLFRTTGTDLTQIEGIDVLTAMTVISEAGWDRANGPAKTILFPGYDFRRTTESVATG